MPCDVQYLGTLGHLTRASLALRERDYLEALVPLLARYPQHFAAHTSSLCEGAIPHLLALAPFALGEKERASIELERGLAMSAAAGFQYLSREAAQTLSEWKTSRPEKPGQDRGR